MFIVRRTRKQFFEKKCSKWDSNSCPADDAMCRMAEVYRKGTQGSVLAWRAASLLLGRLLLYYPIDVRWEMEGRLPREPKLQSEPVGA